MSLEDLNREIEKERENMLEARLRFLQLQERLVVSYLERIRAVYSASDEKNKSKILQGLELFVVRAEDSETPSIFAVSQRKNAAFDYRIARAIREKVYPVRNDFLKAIGLQVDPRGCSTISQYERGKQTPRNPPRGVFAPKYLAWLKEQGYNPFNL